MNSLLTYPGASQATAPGSDFQVGPPPSWAVFRSVPVFESLPEDPVAVALIERQIDLPTRRSFMRTVKRLNNGQGVQHGSRVEITFSPSAESVTVHSVAIIRDGQRREMCHAAAFRVLQREANLDQHILDGELSAMMFLEDVRVGDLIDVSYTLTEKRTAFPGKFSTGQYVRFPIEVGAVYLTIRCEPGRELKAQCVDTSVNGNVSESPEGRIYYWAVNNPAKVRIPAGVPIWHSIAPILWISDFTSWGEVAAMTTRAWSQVWNESESHPQLERQIEEFSAEARSPEAVADNVIRFVQNEIRYLSLEEGIGCFLPQHPVKVFARRFGDCKDKSFLLSYLLNRLGVPARPVLVSAGSQHTVKEMLPSPRSFDHVVVAYYIGKERRFVDATIRDQGGDVRTRVLPQFGVGLVVDEQTADLIELPAPRPDAGEMFIHEEFTFHKKAQPVDLKVTTMAKGLDADFLREQLETVNREHLEREIESRYRQFYKHLQPAGGVEFHDDEMRNVVRIIHRFTIPSVEPTTAGDGRRVYHFPAHAVEGRLVGCSDQSRQAPLAIAFPNKVTQRITATFRGKASVGKIHELTVGNPAFRFSVSTQGEGNVADATFVYENLKDHVPVAEIEEYMEKLNRAFDMLGFNVPARFPWGLNAPTFKKAALIAGAIVIAGALVLAKAGKFSEFVKAPVEGVRAGVETVAAPVEIQAPREPFAGAEVEAIPHDAGAEPPTADAMEEKSPLDINVFEEGKSAKGILDADDPWSLHPFTGEQEEISLGL